ncbi:MAG TPA: glycosyltransferase family 39 protein [Spirochaetota bacterium]|nr:glycosyltransferase family 39 protein [Spirochaetota bacterium]
MVSLNSFPKSIPGFVRAFASRVSENRELFLIVMLSVLMRIAAPQLIVFGGEDVIDTWVAAKRILYGLDYPLIHNTVRFGTIIPVYLTQFFFGTSPIVYYAAPALFQIMTTVALFRLSELVMGRKFALAVCVLFLVFPDTLIAGSHSRTSTFSMFFLVLALYYFVRFLKSEDRTVNASLVLSGVSLFMMYLCNEVTVFFFPGFALVLILTKKSIRPVVALFGVFGLLFIAETALYAIFTQYPFGRFQIATTKHLSEGGNLVPVRSFPKLLGRFSPSSASYWAFLVPVFIAISVYFLSRKRRSDFAIFSLIGLSFIVFITISVKSVHPIVPVVNFRARYLSDLSPVFVMLFCGAVSHLAITSKRRFMEKISEGRNHLYSACAIVLIVILVNAAVYTKKNYGHYNFPAVYPPVQVHRLYRDLNNEYAAGVPVVVKGRHVHNRQAESIIQSVKEQIPRSSTMKEALERADVTSETYLRMCKRMSRIFFTEGKVFEAFMWDERRHASGGEIRLAKPELFYLDSDQFHLYSKRQIPEKKNLFALPYVIDLINKPFSCRKVPFMEIYKSGDIE